MARGGSPISLNAAARTQIVSVTTTSTKPSALLIVVSVQTRMFSIASVFGISIILIGMDLFAEGWFGA
jgi:hypothetical protein